VILRVIIPGEFADKKNRLFDANMTLIKEGHQRLVSVILAVNQTHRTHDARRIFLRSLRSFAAIPSAVIKP
jgi:hypothetical protein